MSGKAVDLNLYRVFDAIYSEGSLTRAGEVLHVTQPAVSNALARLRERYGDRLFMRGASGMQPTPLAESLAPDIRRALALLTDTLSGAGQFDPATSSRRFRLRLSDLLEAMLLPPLLRRLQQVAPAVSLETFQGTRRDLIRDLASGEADLAADALLYADPQLQHRLLVQDNYTCILRPGHPAARRPLTMERYLALQHVLPSSRRRGLGYVDIALRRLGRQRHILLRTQHYLLTPHVVRHTDLALSAPSALARLHGLLSLPLPFEVAPLEIHLYWHRRADADPALAWLRAMIADTAGQASPAAARPEGRRLRKRPGNRRSSGT